MADSEQLGLEVPSHHNQHLFSDHYLNEVLPNSLYWQALGDKARLVMDEVAGIFTAFAPSRNERQTEDNLVVKVLNALGHTYEVQAPLRTPEGTQTPDYVFYRNRGAVIAHKDQVLSDALPGEGGIAVGDAKYWNRPLDIAIKEKSADALSNKNPSYQIHYYMLHSGVTWGMLTNGKHWRLYHKDTAHKLDYFYEVDLEELVRVGDLGRFLYFYVFFRREAFDDGPLSVADILRESSDYAYNVGNSLKSQVYEALRHISQGFLDYKPNGLAADEKTLRIIHDNSLILLYRLIFILYAEARELLPLRDNQKYKEIYSLHAIKKSVARDLDSGRLYLPDSDLLWPKLKRLFNDINEGNPPLKVATFNGGLFDSAKYEFLTKYVVGDAHLQRAIDKLARVGNEFVDYRDLSVRHMGTIYEGLLEYRLQPLNSPEESWDVELVNDRGERKATGSYYTPDHIVKYIVENAVGPLLERVVSDKKSDAGKLQAVLQVNVLDPAMGSGHFLVEATEYIARFLVDLALTPKGKTREEADLAYWKRRVVQSCVYGVDLNPLAVELAKLSLWLTTVAKDRPLSFLDHHLRPGNSLVGAQLQHLNLVAASRRTRRSKDKREFDDAQANGQGSLMTDSDFTQRACTAVGFMKFIEESDAVDVAQVKAQEQAYEQLREQLADKYARRLNLVTADQVGMEIERKHRVLLSTYIASRNAFPVQALERIMDQADELAKQERFFHWELEFPEIYFDTFGRPLGNDSGFEAVVGNPPYVRREQLAGYREYFSSRFPRVYDSNADLYVYFYAQGLAQLRQHGRLAYISSSTFRWLDSGAALREHLTANSTLLQLVDFGDQQVFDDALTYPAIVVLDNARPAEHGGFILHTPGVFDSPSDEGSLVSLPRGREAWIFVSKGLGRIVYGREGSVTLSEFAKQPVYRGVTTGYNQAFVIDASKRDALVSADPACAEFIKPYVRGEDLHPWYQEKDVAWLIMIPSGWTNQTLGSGLSSEEAWAQFCRLCPVLANHLAPYAEAAQERYDKGEYWWELRPCSYYTAFEQLRIHSTKVSLFPSFSISAERLYAGNTSYVIPVSDLETGHYLLGLLNSRVSEFFCRSVFAPKANGYYEVQPGKLEQFPVPCCSKKVSGAIGAVARRTTSISQQRYALHCQVRHRLQSDFGTVIKAPNRTLAAWWKLDFASLRTELKKAFNTDIQVGSRDQWETWFSEQVAEHRRLTGEIVGLETKLNDLVYELYELTSDEINQVEKASKYSYGSR